MTTITITLGMRLALARKAAGIQPAEMARIAGKDKATISKYENDKLPVPTAVLYVYQQECNVSREYIEGKAELTQEVVTSRCNCECPCQGMLFADAA